MTIAAGAALEAGSLARPKVDIQLKATTQQHLEHAEFVSWELEMPHYNSLRAPALSPHLLVVLMLPANVEESVEPDSLREILVQIGRKNF